MVRVTQCRSGFAMLLLCTSVLCLSYCPVAAACPSRLLLITCVVPRALAGDQEYDQHVHVHGRRHRSAAEYLRRRDHYYANKKFIEVG